MRFGRDIKGAMGGKALLAIGAILVVATLFLSGVVNIKLPTQDNEYEQTVTRLPTHIGMEIPIDVRLKFYQDAGTNKADISVEMKHRHPAKGSDGNYVPDPELISSSNYNTKIGNIDDSDTIYAVNGNSYRTGDTTFDIPIKTVNGAYTGPAQDNFKVWTNADTYQPPDSNPTVDNHGIIIQLKVDYYRKATGQLLNSFIVNFLTYYQLPEYNVDGSWAKSYRYYLYVPFDDYARFQDIELELLGYVETCRIEWRSVTTVTRVYWECPFFNWLFPGANVKLAQTRDVNIPTAITYSWQPLIPWPRDNGDVYGSHFYTYKIR